MITHVDRKFSNKLSMFHVLVGYTRLYRVHSGYEFELSNISVFSISKLIHSRPGEKPEIWIS
jgi:hypothetical protein